MIIKPSIRNNLFTNSHPLGCEKNVLNQIETMKKKPTFEGPKNVLIIGGSSGYGLASRISLAIAANANTINVSFESAPKGKRSGTAGFWNNVAFQKHIKNTKNKHKDFLGDAFSSEMKSHVIDYVNKEFGKIDLVIYSLASGARKNHETGEVRYSSIKSLDKDVVGKTLDVITNKIEELTVTPATEQEIKDTVYVMGGSDWKEWIKQLDDANVLNNNFKTIAYTYIGGETTKDIYREGTLGKAKEDLEITAKQMNNELQEKYNGEALISSSKAVATKASIYIPQMPIYVAALYDTMIKENVFESIVEHKYRLFKDMVYGNKRLLDSSNRIRLDHQEMDDNIQNKTKELMYQINDSNIHEYKGTQVFLEELYNLNGFRYDEIDYDAEVNVKELSAKYDHIRL